MNKTSWNHIDLLAKKALLGDQAKYREFLQLISDYIKFKIRRVIPKNCQDDVTQEVLLAIHKSLKTLDTDKPTRPWVNAICQYKINDCLRSIYKNADTQNPDELENLYADNFDKTEFKQLIEHISSAITQKEAKILLMLKYEGQTVLEVSKELGIGQSNIKVISFRAIKKIREFLTKEEFYD